MQLPPDERPPSKSARKRAAHAAQKLGEELVLLKDADLLALDLPEALTEAIRAARSIRSRAALARQRQYIGKLMREIDPEPIEAALAARARQGARRPRRYAPEATGYNAAMKPLVGIIMGSSSDWETMQRGCDHARRPVRSPTRYASSPRIARRICCSNTPRARARAASKSSSPAPAAPRTCPA